MMRPLRIPKSFIKEAAWVLPFEGHGHTDNIEGPEAPGKKPMPWATGWPAQENEDKKTKWFTASSQQAYQHLIRGGNLAIVLGQRLNDNGVLACVDLDTKEDFDKLKEKFPNTLTIVSGRGGHLYFSVPEETASYNSEREGKLVLEFKVRSPNGTPMTATIPPSIHVKRKIEYVAINYEAPIQELKAEDIEWLKLEYPPQIITKTTIDAKQKKYTISCLDVATRAGLKIRNKKALCPFHNDNNPSLELNYRKKDLWWCNGCKTGGDAACLILLLEQKGIVVTLQ